MKIISNEEYVFENSVDDEIVLVNVLRKDINVF